MFGLGAVLGKMVASVLNPILVTFLNFSLGGLLLLLLVLYQKKHLLTHLSRRDWLQLFLLSFFGTAIPACCVIYGLSLTSALKAGFLMQTQGVAAVLFAVLFLRERLIWKQVVGIMLLLLGSLLVVMKDLQTPIWQSFNLGDGLLVLGSLGFGYAFLPAKQLTVKIASLPLTVWKLLLGAIFVLPLLLFQTTAVSFSFSPLLFWALPLYVVSNFCVGYVTQQEGLKHLPAWEAAMVMQSMPLFSTLFAILLLHERISLMQIIGGLIILVGGVVLTLADLRKRNAYIVPSAGTSVADNVIVPDPHSVLSIDKLSDRV